MLITRGHKDNYYQIPLVQGLQGKYYIVDGQKYDEHFPKEWALNHLSYWNGSKNLVESGPKNCANCRSYGSINGVFVFYCLNCTDYAYECTRGGLSCSPNVTEGELWREFPYMYGVTFDEIGDAPVQTHYSAVNDLDEKELDACMRKVVSRKNKKG